MHRPILVAFLSACLTLSLALVALADESPRGCAAYCSGLLHPDLNVMCFARHINLVGWFSGAADPANAADSLDYGAQIEISIRDVSNNPVGGWPVAIDFSGCASDVRIAATQSYHGLVTTCARAWVQGVTASNGIASFVVIGGRVGDTDHPADCATVYIPCRRDGPLDRSCFSLGVGTYDQTNVAGGMSLADIGLAWRDVNSGLPHDRTDFDGNGYLTLADIAYVWDADMHPFDRSAGALCP